MSGDRSGGCVAAGNPAAARVGADILGQGGNAVDSAIATVLAMCVADPANISLFGRCHALVREPGGAVTAINGATRTPVRTPPLGPAQNPRTGFGAAAFPGLPQALMVLHQQQGRLAFSALAEPAARLAEAGVAAAPRLSRIWRKFVGELAAEPGANRYYGRVADRIRHPALAELLRAYGESGADGILTRDRTDAVAAAGGFWSEQDLAPTDDFAGETVTVRFRDWQVTTLGRQAWGHTLAQMLLLLDNLPGLGPEMAPAEARRLNAVILQALDDRPQHVGSLTPKAHGPGYADLLDSAFIAGRVAALTAATADPAVWGEFCRSLLPPGQGRPDQDTTHLAVVDSDGLAVSMTASIGPHFGARVADPLDGVLLANSYEMAHQPRPGGRDVTEMAPAIATGPAGQVLAVGAAGSERIPGAVAQVLANLIDRDLGLKAAVAAPRVNVKDGRLRLHSHMPQAVVENYKAAALRFEPESDDPTSHLGIVQAVLRDGEGTMVGAADPAYDGTAVSAA